MVQVNDIVGEGDKIVTRWTMIVSSKFRDIQVSDKKMTVWMITVDRMVDGKFVEEWERFDTLGMMPQLGLYT